ncbi:MAG: sugar porter family MFS transporter [Chthoniobacterales bacterium]|nr:sugar porter family MFS transporter [Chthoniobacterales bacterium]
MAPNLFLKSNFRIYVIGFTAALVGLLFGLGIGVISGAANYLQHDLKISDDFLELIVAAPLWGAVIGTLITGFFSQHWGRKKIMLLSALIFIAGSLLCSLSTSADQLLLARTLFGVAIGIASFITPIYISEIAPKKIRGTLMSLYIMLIATGVLMAFVSNTFISTGWLHCSLISDPWRLMLGIVALPACMTFIGILFLPESPRWLFLNEFTERGVAVLQKIGCSPEQILQEKKEIATALHKKEKGFFLLKTSSPFRRVLLLGISLQVIQQITGINIVLFYAPRIFQFAGFSSTSEQLWGTIFIGIVNMLSTLIALFFIDKLGRKPIMTLGLLIMGISLATVGLLLKMDLQYHPVLANIAAGALLLFIFGFGMSAGPVVWLLCSEVFPLAGKDFGVTFSTAANWISNAIVSGTFLSLLHQFGNANTFLLYAVFQAFSLLFFFLFVPETKGVSLEKIESNLFSGLPLRKIGS